MNTEQPKQPEQPNSFHSVQPSGNAATTREVCHTPGPWRVGREIGESQLMPRIEILRDITFVVGVRPVTYYIAEVCYPTTTGNTVGAGERRANARLIAAAPDLLGVAQMVLDEATDSTPPALIAAAEAAIARVTGAAS